MGYRLIFSQMFDVRPRNEAGDLDFEKIAKIQALLNLRLYQENVLGEERIINLKSKLREIEIRSVGYNDQQTKETAEKGFFGKNSRSLYYRDEERPLDSRKKDILSIFEIIEATEHLLKDKKAFLKGDELSDEEYEIPIKKVFERHEEVIELKQEVSPEQIGVNNEILEEPRPLEGKDNPELVGRIEVQPQIYYSPSEVLQNAIYPEFKPSFNEENNLIFSDVRDVILPEFYRRERKQNKPLFVQKKKKAARVFLGLALIIFLAVPLAGWLGRALTLKADIVSSGLNAYGQLLKAKEALGQMNFFAAEKNFAAAYAYFSQANSQVNEIGGPLVSILETIPGLTSLSSGVRLIEAGQDLSKAGENFSQTLALFGGDNLNIFSGNIGNSIFPDKMAQAKMYLESAFNYLASAKYNLDLINVASLPPDMQPPLAALKDKMPEILQFSASANDWVKKLSLILGEKTPQKYLLIFQNNAEARATGGFIGTYGILDLDQGQIKKLFIDGIFNPDGQLSEKIIPPEPLQKIAIPWTTHDANWFADFPTSAQKIMWFYERTGGPTPDGVISLTPTVIERLLKLTGPIEMPEYGVILDADNFIDITQYKTEIDYDKDLNQPKKILADFAPRFLDKLSEQIKQNNLEVLRTIDDALKEKHILVYFGNQDLENFVVSQGWGGELKQAQKDYFSVVNSNIDGRKTDRVIEQKIKYLSEIQDDGSIIDTLEIVRHHQGGALNYNWYNEPNIDYLRVYLPKGAELISVQGQSQVSFEAQIDYQKFGFKKDQQVDAIEQTMQQDEKSGTEIFEESGKTVFGNWVNVNPGETASIIYKYRLPFKLATGGTNADFSLLAQKQSGSLDSKLEVTVNWPQTLNAISLPGAFNQDGNMAGSQTDLTLDRLFNFKFSNVK